MRHGQTITIRNFRRLVICGGNKPLSLRRQCEKCVGLHRIDYGGLIVDEQMARAIVRQFRCSGVLAVIAPTGGTSNGD